MTLARLTSSDSSAIDWGLLSPLRLHARSISDGLYVGAHRSPRRGAGVEFGGHRPYTPGDDVRWLDHRALMRHGRLLVRQFETETDRTLHLIIDASRSMEFRGPNGPASKYAYAALIGLALARVAIAGGDPVALDVLGRSSLPPLPAMAGAEAFERIGAYLEEAVPAEPSTDSPDHNAVFARVGRRARRGAVVVLISDLLEPEAMTEPFAALGSRRRTPIALQVLDPVEAEFPFKGAVLLRNTESSHELETDADAVRDGYLKNLRALKRAWRDAVSPRGGRLVSVRTTDSAVETVRDVLAAAQGREHA